MDRGLVRVCNFFFVRNMSFGGEGYWLVFVWGIRKKVMDKRENRKFFCML